MQHIGVEPYDTIVFGKSAEEIDSRSKFLRLASILDKHPTDSNIAEGFMSYFELLTNRPGMLDSAEVYLRLNLAEKRLTLVDSDPNDRALFLEALANHAGD